MATDHNYILEAAVPGLDCYIQ